MMLARRELLGKLSFGAVALGTGMISTEAMAACANINTCRTRPIPRLRHVPMLKAQPPYTRTEDQWRKRRRKSGHKHKPRLKARSLRAQYTYDTPGNRRDLACTMWGEARGYGTLGMRCVGHVIMNRLKLQKKRFGLTVSGVCHKRKHFSCWNKGDPNRIAIENLPKKDENNPDWIAFMKADKLAGEILAGILPDITGGATFYYAESMPHKPYWIDDMTLIGVQFGHMFCKEKSRKARKKSKKHNHDSHHHKRPVNKYDHSHASHH